MRLILLVVPALVLSSLHCTNKEPPAPPPPPLYVPKDWKFEATPDWTDEFTTEGKPDAAKWGYDTGGSGWGNNELQHYTAGNNVAIKNGMLEIEVRKEPMGNRNYTSTRLASRGKGDFLYGRFEARAKLPKGRGLWPAIWMLPTDWAYGDWPRSGEIDIMEEVGFDPYKIHMSVHTESYNHRKNTQKTGTTILPTAQDSFHLYRLDWTPDGIKGYVDDVLVLNFPNERKSVNEWPFDKKFHWLLNVAVGGDWGGIQGIDDTVFPATFKIDYVRTYKLIP